MSETKFKGSCRYCGKSIDCMVSANRIFTYGCACYHQHHNFGEEINVTFDPTTLFKVLEFQKAMRTPDWEL